MMATRVDGSPQRVGKSPQRFAQGRAAHDAEQAARFLRGAVGISTERSGSHLALAEPALAWGPLDEHGTAPSAPTQEFAAGVHFAGATTTDSEHADAAGDAEAAAARRARARIVGELYQSSYHRVHAFARRLVCDEEAEEIAHESFVRLLRVRNLERMTVSVAYLLRIAENLVRRRHGRAQRYREVLERSGRMGPDIEAHHDERPVVAGVRDARTDSAWSDPERLQSVLCRLTPSEQSAIRLIVCEGLDYQAAARSLGVPVSTINNWKHRALAKLKQIIESDVAFSRIPGRHAVDTPQRVASRGVGRALEAC